MTPSTVRCADAAIERNEPIYGTASHVKRWLFIEQPGGWGRDALLESRLPQAFGPALRAKVRHLGVRVILIRRGARFSTGSRHVYFANTSSDGHWLQHSQVDDVTEILDLDLTPLATGARIAGAEDVSGPMFLVCTHGRHDACCSVRGNQVSRIACSAYEERAWECSHIGGDRFAANVVAFPYGLYLGHVLPGQTLDILRELDGGRIPLPHYRGRSAYPFDVQAAEYFLRRDLGEVEVEAVGLESFVRNPEEPVMTARFELSEGRAAKVVVKTRLSTDTYRLTCRAEKESPIPSYALVSCEVYSA